MALAIPVRASAIVVIGHLLAGDNATDRARRAYVAAHLQSAPIVWGAVGAILVRSALTVVGCLAAQDTGPAAGGGLLLVWIGYRCWLPEEHQRRRA